MLQPTVLRDYEELSGRAADWLLERVRESPAALLCVAAGATPSRAYELLAERGAAEPGLFRRVRLLKLDEWGGLARNDPATCESQLRDLLVGPLGLADRYVAFDSNPADPAAECRRVAQWLAHHGPIDVCVLGLGLNGHVGFNEPADVLLPRAHVAELTEPSLSHPMLNRSERRPTYGLTLGMADILQSRHILLLVSGKEKQEPLQRLLSVEVTTQLPASLLHLHSDAVLLCDRSAAPMEP